MNENCTYARSRRQLTSLNINLTLLIVFTYRVVGIMDHQITRDFFHTIMLINIFDTL